MKNLACSFLTVVITAFFSVCNAQKVNLNDELQSLRMSDKKWSDASVSKDVRRYMEFYDKDATVIDNYGHITKDRDTILKNITEFFSMSGFSLTFNNESAVVAKSADLGYTTGTWSMQMNNEKGELMKSSGPYLVIWKKQSDGSWKAIVDSYWNPQ
jgi:ketosteroid isomerase-like protein